MNPHLNRLSNLLLLLLGMCSICALIIESFHLVVPKQIWIWLAALCICLWFSASFSRGLLVGMPLCAVILYMLWRNYTVDLSAELLDVIDHIYGAYSGHYSSTGGVYQYSNLSENHMVSLLFVMFLVSAFTAACLTSAGFRVSLVMLPSVLLFLLCIAVNGTPSVWPVILLFLFWCVLFAGGDVYRPDDAAGKSSFLILLPCLAILLFFLLFFRPENYHYNQHDIDLSLHFDKLGSKLSNWLDEHDNALFTLTGESQSEHKELQSAPAGWDTSAGILDLTKAYDYSADEKKAFEVSSDQSGSYYLRGRSFGDYIGTAWESAVENSRNNALSLTAQAVYGSYGTQTQHFQLITSHQYPYLYLPYYSITENGSDVSVPANMLSGYGGDYYISPLSYASLLHSASKNDIARESELQYREYAHNYYTRLPDSTRSALQLICKEHGFSAADIEIIADYIKEIGVYDLDVDVYPSEDYAVYFLTVSSHGYCIHFATAACALYRSLGIPSRICEGYLVTSRPNQFVSVTGRDAHAWVEVYLDGVGWIPVEVTADISESTAEINTGIVNESPSPSVEPSPIAETPEQGSPTEEMDLSAGEIDAENGLGFAAESSAEPNSEAGLFTDENGSDTVSSVSDSIRQHQTSLAVRILLWFILTIALIGACLELRYLILRFWVAKQLKDDDRKQAVMFMYRRAELILKLAKRNSDLPLIIRTTAEKARFSQHDLDEREVLAVHEAFDELALDVWSSLSRIDRFRFKTLHGLY